jgi:hypothetical protein
VQSLQHHQAAIRDLFKVTRDSAGNLPPMPGVFPDYPAQRPLPDADLLRGVPEDRAAAA